MKLSDTITREWSGELGCEIVMQPPDEVRSLRKGLQNLHCITSLYLGNLTITILVPNSK